VKTFQIENTFVALDDACGARPLPVTPDFWDALQNGRLGNFSRMVSYYAFDQNWTTWEKHPAGEELVCLIEGDVDLVLVQNGGETIVAMNQPGSFILVPKNTWHTARVRKPSKMLFITPGDGTENKPV
jgi:mannose-6-phosphate isomerase-like protein (cupin superfamily)